MLLIPLLYFIGLGIYFYKKQQCWNIDIAAVSLLVLISFLQFLLILMTSMECMVSMKIILRSPPSYYSVYNGLSYYCLYTI